MNSPKGLASTAEPPSLYIGMRVMGSGSTLSRLGEGRGVITDIEWFIVVQPKETTRWRVRKTGEHGLFEYSLAFRTKNPPDVGSTLTYDMHNYKDSVEWEKRFIQAIVTNNNLVIYTVLCDNGRKEEYTYPCDIVPEPDAKGVKRK